MVILLRQQQRSSDCSHGTPSSTPLAPSATKAGGSGSPAPSSPSANGSPLSVQLCDPQHKDCLFREFRKLCATVAEHNSYNVKTQIIEKFLKKGSAGGRCVCVCVFFNATRDVCPPIVFSLAPQISSTETFTSR